MDIFGLAYRLLKWPKSKVFVKSSFSESKVLGGGVPQGSVLGPLLFLIYVNDIADSLLSITRLFADDSSLAVSSRDVNMIEETLNHDLNSILVWSKQWLVNFNPAKTEAMFLTYCHRNSPTLLFDNTLVQLVDHHKHLGLTLSRDGSWHQHISNIIATASKILGTMKMMKFKLHRKTLNQIYLSYLRPHLEYGSLLWDNCAQYEKETLDKIQYEAARIVTGLTRSV